MSKLTRQQIAKLNRQMQKPAERGQTWIGLRPSVMKDKLKDIKIIRRINKQICKDAERSTYGDN